MECQVMGITMYYEAYGSGRPFFGLHGWPLDHRHMVREYEPLFENRAGWRRIYPDMPGMGQTPGPGWLTCHDQMLDVMLAFIDTVAPDERFIAAGTSYGGYIAQGLVHKRGEQMDGVMFNVPSVFLPSQENYPLPEHRVIHQDPGFLAELKPGEKIVDMLAVQSLDALHSIRDDYDTAAAIADKAFLDVVRKQGDFSFSGVLPQPFDAPALFLTGRFDIWCGYKPAFALLDQFPRATFAVLDRASHALVMEANDLFLALGRDWLDRVEETIQERTPDTTA